MTPDLKALLGMLGSNANQAMNHPSGQQYAQSIAGGKNVPKMITPGVSYSMENPQGYTQADLDRQRIFDNFTGIMPPAPTQGNRVPPDYETMPGAPTGTPMPSLVPITSNTPNRYSPIITDADSLKNLTDLFNANLPDNIGVSFDPFIPGEPMAIDDLQPTLFDIPFTADVGSVGDNLPSTGSSQIDFSNINFTMPSAPTMPSTGPAPQEDNANYLAFLQTPEYQDWVNSGGIGTMDRYTASDGREFGSGTVGRMYDEYLASLGQQDTNNPVVDSPNVDPVVDDVVIDNLPSTGSSQIDFTSPINFKLPIDNPYEPIVVDPIPQPVDVPVDPMPTYYVPEIPVLTPGMTVNRTQPQQSIFAPEIPESPEIPAVVSDFIPSIQDLPTLPVGMPFIPNEPMPFIPNEPMPSVSMQNYNDQLIKEILDPTPVSSPIQNFGGYNNVRSFLR